VQLRQEKWIVGDHVRPCAFVEERQPRRLDELRIAPFTTAWRRLATEHATEKTAPPDVGAIGWIGGKIDEQPLDAHVEAGLLAYFADDAFLLGFVFATAAGQHPPIASVAENATDEQHRVVVAENDGLISRVSVGAHGEWEKKESGMTGDVPEDTLVAPAVPITPECS
jgi:hypothetical protein